MYMFSDHLFTQQNTKMMQC